MITLDHVVEIALLILAAYLGGCVLGYGARRLARRLAARPQPVAAPLPAPSAARRLAQAAAREEAFVAPPPAPLRRPPELPAPRPGGPDDLTRIKGIGVKTEATLNDLGIYHFDQIAAWSPAHLDWLEGRVAIKGRIRREQWVEQAILLATAPTMPARRAG